MNLRKFHTLALAFISLVTMSACGNQTAEAETTVSENSVTITENESTTTSKTTTTAPAVTTTKATTESAEPDAEMKNTYLTAWKNSIGTSYMMLIYQIENTGNVPLYFTPGSCEVVDETGGLIDIYQNVNAYPSIIDPGECVYYYTTESFDLNEYEKAGLDDILIKPELDISKNENIRYDVTDVTLRDEEYFGIKAIGRVENNNSESGNLVTVAVVLFDSSDKPIGVLTDILMDELTPGRQVSFEASDLILPDDLTVASVDHYEAFAYPLQYQF